MFENTDSPTPWPEHDRNSTSSVDWALAFVAANPEAGSLKPHLAVWFLYALRAGYAAGAAHSEYPDA